MHLVAVHDFYMVVCFLALCGDSTFLETITNLTKLFGLPTLIGCIYQLFMCIYASYIMVVPPLLLLSRYRSYAFRYRIPRNSEMQPHFERSTQRKGTLPKLHESRPFYKSPSASSSSSCSPRITSRESSFSRSRAACTLTSSFLCALRG